MVQSLTLSINEREEVMTDILVSVQFPAITKVSELILAFRNMSQNCKLRQCWNGLECVGF